MIAERLTQRWQNAGLIDRETAERIVAWETAHRRPIWFWAISSTGALAVALGVMAIVGANWDDIPAWVKLAADLGLNLVCAIAVFAFWRRGLAWPREVAALLLFGLVLSGIALIGQVYHLQSDSWHALVLWLALCTPFLALTALTRFNGTIWALAAATTWYASEAPVSRLLGRIGALPKNDYGNWEYTFPLLAYLPACLLIVVSGLRGLWPVARTQADLLLKLALAGMILACSVTMSFDERANGDTAPLGLLATGLAATILAVLALRLDRARADRRISMALITASFAGWTAAILLAKPNGATGELAQAVLFILYWAVLGALAARDGWRGLFGLAFTVIGLRRSSSTSKPSAG